MSAVTLADLPDDILLTIGSSLDLLDLIHLGECNRAFNVMLRDNQLWLHLLERDLPFVTIADTNDACDIYRSYYDNKTIWSGIFPPCFPLTSSDASAVLEWPVPGPTGSEVVFCALMGSESTEKTELVCHPAQPSFRDCFDPMIENSYRKMVNVISGDSSMEVAMEVLDTSGDYCSPDSTGYLYEPHILRRLQATAIVIDVTARDSLDVAVLQLQVLLTKYIIWQDLLDRGLPLPILFILSKTDVPATRWQVSMMELRKLTHRYHGHYIQVSSKTRVGVADAFTMLVLMGMYTSHQTLNDSAQPVLRKNATKHKCLVM
eukprot:TRINITY_DN3849_c0_g1_i6.p1 TRINITY_DN3849_c0_g1~~TRINITY_DN3849_c0_g1_i6.p1  ORF type:complete len:347 (+),score=41.69 TRINITY_DN3849_c0_g1_i6:90-1043(+)